jgi:hypothetical protein
VIKKLYAPNLPQRRIETFIRAEGRCENILSNGQRCPVSLGHTRITHSGNMQFEELLIHHINGDPENPDSEMLAVCWACHMRLHRKPGPGRKKASARKQGYEVVRVQFLLEQLTVSGLHTWRTSDGHTGWQIGPLTSEAENPIEALAMALHWQASEIRDLEAKLQQSQEHIRDLEAKLQQSQERTHACSATEQEYSHA